MRTVKGFLLAAAWILLLSACVEIKDETYERRAYSQAPEHTAFPPVDDVYAPCRQETTVVVYDDAGTYRVPGCMDYVPQIYAYAESSAEKEKLKRMAMTEVKFTPPAPAEPVEEKEEVAETEEAEEIEETEEDVNPDEIEGHFPEVENNKYYPHQVVLQNLQTRILAYCRGPLETIDECVERLECAGYKRLTEVPGVTAKYDLLQKGQYPSRRWRGGEYVPRW